MKTRRDLFLWGGLLIFFSMLCMPFGFPLLLWGIFMVSRGTRIKALPAPAAKKQVLPPKPKAVKGPVCIPAYQKRINQLIQLEDQADRLLASLSAYLDQLFADSQVTKARYMTTISKAETMTDVNLAKAKRAIDMFGNGEVTKERIQLLDGYVNNSQKMVTTIENIVTELMRAEQTQLIRDTDQLDKAMNELKETVKFYTPA